MKISSRLLAGAGLAAMAATGAATNAYAQNDEIVVTATKREQTLQEVPIAVSVVGAETIQDAQIVDIIDLQASVPSLRVTQQQNASQTNFIIRGFGNGANNPGIEPSVGVFIDGVYRSRSAAALLDLPEIERVEVLRGPQSTLFGKNVSVGAISITTQLPSFEWEATAEATYGNLGTKRFRGTLSGPISDTLAFRVSGSTNNRDGTYTNVFNGQDNLNERDRWAVRGQLLWEPTETLRFRAIADYNKIDEACCGTVLLVNGPVTAGVIGVGLGEVIPPSTDPGDRLAALNLEPPNELEGRGVSLQGDWDLGFAVLTSITSVREQRDRNDTDVDFTAADIAVQPQEVEYETFTQELRLAGEFESGIGVFNWLAGGFLFNEEVNFQQSTLAGTQFRDFGNLLIGGNGFADVEGGSQIVAALTQGPTALFPEFGAANPTILGIGDSFQPGRGFSGSYDLENRSYSFFFQTDWEVTERLTLTGGVSYTNDRKKAVGNTINNEPFYNADLTQFFAASGSPAGVGTGSSILAAGSLGAALGLAPSPAAGVGALFADTTGYLTALGIEAATNPAFAATRSAVVAGTTAAVTADPTLNPLATFAGLTGFQFIPPQTSFPQPTAVRDDGITLSDDGYVVDDAINVTARLAYDLTDSLNVYFSYATGYKAPAINLSQDARPPSLNPDGRAVGRFAFAENVRVFEIGGKMRFDGGFLNVALFDQKVEDFQSNAFTGTGFIFANAGEQSVRGFEVDALYSPVDPMTLTFGLTYLDPNFDSFTAAACPAAGVAPFTDPAVVAACAVPGVSTIDRTGTNPSGIHPVSISTSASYEFVFGSNTLTPRIEYLFESETDLFADGNALAPTRKVSQINANIAFAMENGFSVNLWGRNLNNDDALITAFPSVAQVGSLNGYVTTPRTYGVSIRKDF